MKKESILYSQIIPLLVAFVSTIIFIAILFANITISNSVFPKDPIVLAVRVGDFLLGLYLYVKTSIDFAVFIGSMLSTNQGWKNRIAVEWGTSIGNFLGTLLVLWVWTIFRQTSPLLEGIIVLIASFVLLELAAGSLSRINKDTLFARTANFLLKIRFITSTFLGWMPDLEGTMAGKKLPSFKALLLYSFTVPFVLGSDDFAGYISVFNVVNVFSFATGVVVGHGLLLAAIFAVPKAAERVLATTAFSILAVITFFVIFLIGFTDATRILLEWGKSNNVAFVLLLLATAVWVITHHTREIINSGLEKTREAALRLIKKQ